MAAPAAPFADLLQKEPTRMVKRTEEPFDALHKLLEHLLGPVEEWTTDDVEQFLVDAGVDTERLQQRLYDLANELAGTYRARNQNLPAHLADFLDQLRPRQTATSDK